MPEEETDLDNLSREEMKRELIRLKKREEGLEKPGPAGTSASSTTIEAAAIAYLRGVTQKTDDVDLVIAYLKDLRKERLHLALAQLDAWQAVADQSSLLELPSIYTELHVDYRDTPREMEAGDEKRLREKMVEQAEDTPPVTVSSFAAGFEKAVILGDPGSGKSTFTNMLAFCLSSEILRITGCGIDDLLPGWNSPPVDSKPAPRKNLLPLYVVLREFAGGDQSIWDHLAARIDGLHMDGTSTAIKHIIFSEGGVLILDGLDEVPEADDARDQIVGAVAEFAARFPKVRIVVTSRPYAFEQKGWALEKFETTRLSSFDPDQRKEFIRKWFAHAAPKKGLDEKTSDRRRDQLISQIEKHGHIRDLAENPLLLTMICLLDLAKGGGVPENREELYSRCVELLLEIWQKPVMESNSSAATLQDYIGVSKDDLLTVISEVAFDFHSEQGQNPGLADIPRASIVDALFELAQKANNRIATTEGILSYLENRAGLLNDCGGVYRFPHRTFQEYLASLCLSEMDQIAIFEKLLEDPKVKWREPFLLAGAKISKGREASLWELIGNFDRFLPPYGQFQQVHWRIVALLFTLIRELRLHQSLSEHPIRQDTFVSVRDKAVDLIENPEPTLPNLERHEVGLHLGQIGDPRAGTGCCENGCPEFDWVEISSGTFLFGDPAEEKTIDTDFQISKHLVTRKQFHAFVVSEEYENDQWWRSVDNDPKYRIPSDAMDWSLGNLPMNRVSWFTARAFCDWAGKKTGLPIALPTELEWECTARGTSGNRFPWGDSEEKEDLGARCNCLYSGIKAISPVGLFPQGDAVTAHGRICDLSGNVFEWCEDWYDSDEDWKVLRGGSFVVVPEYLRSSARDWDPPGFRDLNVGFRVCCRPHFSPDS